MIPLPPPSSRQPARKKSNRNLPRGGTYKGRPSRVGSGTFEPIQFQPLQGPATPRNRSTSPSTPPAYTPPLRTQRSIDDVENSTANVTSVEEFDGVSSLEGSEDDEGCELPPPVASSRFSSMQAEHPFSSPHKNVPDL
jgi:hypothetical protein